MKLFKRKTKDIIRPAVIQPNEKKYVFDFSAVRKFNVTGLWTVDLYRIRAVRDIPLHNVKAGDYGGWLEGEHILDHFGDSWVGEEAKVTTGVRVMDNALVTGNASVSIYFRPDTASQLYYVKDNAKIRGNATLISCKEISGNVVIEGEAKLDYSSIYNDAVISEAAYVHASTVTGFSEVRGEARVSNSRVSGYTVITDQANVYAGSSFYGNNRITGNTKIGPNEKVENLVVNGNERRPFPMANSHLHEPSSKLESEQLQWNAAVDSVLHEIMERENIVKDNNGKFSFAKGTQSKLSRGERSSLIDEADHTEKRIAESWNEMIAAINTVEEEYNSYAHDIVKLLKYPLMTDSSFPPVGKFTQKLRKAKRAVASESKHSLTENLVDELESAFLAMQSACTKEMSRSLGEKEQKSLKTATNLVALALDESSSEQEKENAAKKALDYLEGVVLLPDEAVTSFRIKAGLKELTQ